MGTIRQGLMQDASQGRIASRYCAGCFDCGRLACVVGEHNCQHDGRRLHERHGGRHMTAKADAMGIQVLHRRDECDRAD